MEMGWNSVVRESSLKSCLDRDTRPSEGRGFQAHGKSKHEHLSQEHTRHVHRQVKTQYDRCAGKGGLGKSGVKEASGWVTLDTGT